MAIPTVTITGKVLAPNGAAPTSGTVKAELSQPARALDGSESDWVMGRVSAALGAGGALALALVPNDALVPAGTVYKLTYSLLLASGDVWSWSEYVSIPSSPSSVNIGAVTRVAQPSQAIFVAGPTGPAGSGSGGASVSEVAIGSEPTPASNAPAFLWVTEAGEPTLLKMLAPNDSGGWEYVTIGQTVG